MHFVLLNLDEQLPIPSIVRDELCAYVKAFFGCELKVVEVPVTPIAPEVPSGWGALKERCQTALYSKPGREGAVASEQLFSPHLLQCLHLVHEDPARYGIDCEDAEVVLGVTLNEFYHDPTGLRPDEPVPAEGTKDFFIGSAARGVGAISVAQLELSQSVQAFTLDKLKGSSKLPKQIFKLVTNSLLKLLGLRTCSSHQCCAYMKAFAVDVTPLHLCFSCEEALLKKMNPGATRDLVKDALTRYSETRRVVERVNNRLQHTRLGNRRFVEFEEEHDWLLLAEETLTECSSERFRFAGTEGPQCRRRSLRNCLKEVHERQPGRTLHRIYSEPLLKRTCLLDMTQAKPHVQESGDLHKWTTMVMNRKHNFGGHYVESGGSLRPKTIATFVDSGLNASLLKNAGPTKENRIFVGGLSENTTNQSLRKYFEQYGAIDATVTLDPNHSTFRTKGFGIVTFKNNDTLQEALGVKHIVDGRCVDCRESVVQTLQENRHNKRELYGMDYWKKCLKSANPDPTVLPRSGSRLASTEEWKPSRSRKNALSLTYTTSLPSLSATA